MRFRTALAMALATLAAGCSSGGPAAVVVVYSPHGSDVLRDYEARFEAAYPECDVQWLDMGAKDVYNRVRASQSRPACDVWWGAPSTLFDQAAKEDLLAVYAPEWANALAPSYKDAEHRWHATFVSPLAILYNDRQYKEDEVPQTWDALLDDAWKGKIALRKPLPSGTMRTFICAMIERAESEDAGFEWLAKLHAATAEYPENPNLLYDHIKRNPERISVWIQPDIVMQHDLNGFPFGYHIPPQTPVLTDGIALINGAPHADWGKKFIDFVTRPDELVHQAEAYAKMPARSDIPKDQLPEWMRNVDIDAMDIDWARFAENETAWCARWEQEVYRGE
ncbi:MAG: extracellular solute-binding protein [Candidatus Hydrogenedens sp.]|nr:extracellular solute-binding protein [Candidatus Hydrogenedens sp.]